MESQLAFETLPIEIRDEICAHIAPRRADLSAFSLTSVSCGAIARRYRLQRIHLKLTPELPYQITELWIVLQGTPTNESGNGFRHVQVVTLSGKSSHPSPIGQLPSEIPPDSDDSDDDGAAREHEEEDFFKDREDWFRSPVHSPEQYCPYPIPKSARDRRIEATWPLLFRVIERLPNLQDLVYLSAFQVPRGLLKVLHKMSPRPNLHVQGFNLRSLYQPPDAAPHQCVDSDDFLLATSPCLKSISAHWYDIEEGAKLELLMKVIMRMASGLAQNLTSVDVGHVLWHRDEDDDERQEPIVKENSLRRLVCDPEDFLDWADHIDLDQLRTLEVTPGVPFFTPDPVMIMHELVRDHSFGALQSLALTVRSLAREQDAQADQEASVLFLRLQPLRTIKLRGCFSDSTFRAILHRHGNALRELQLLPDLPVTHHTAFVLTSQHLEGLRVQCPHVERIELSIPRTKGDRREAALYLALGQLPRLRFVSLHLDGSQSMRRLAMGDPRFRLGHSLLRFYLPELLINHAVDETLARSIFGLIERARSRLTYLRLNIGEAAYPMNVLSDGDASNLMGYVARSWVCEKNHHGHVAARQIMNDCTWKADEGRELLMGDFEYRLDLQDLWTSIWPGPPGDRSDHWFSWSLADPSEGSRIQGSARS